MKFRRAILTWKAPAPAPAPPPPPPPTVSVVSSTSAVEGSNIVHTVTLSGAPSSPVSFALAFSGSSATGGGVDYTSSLSNANFSNSVTISGGTITVPAGVSSFTVTVPTVDDLSVEAQETYTLTIGGASGTGTITDNDTTPGAGGAWQDSVAAPAGSASFTAEWGEPEGAPTAWVLLFGPNQLDEDSAYTAFPYRQYISNGSARSQVISGIAAGRYYWRIAPVENGTLGRMSHDKDEDAA
ncbi:hypothetical protein [Piscinibacter gummiphilus]|uniref:Calx-beta domain-containing protein n=1 Tax=Piscinibacter gummiphilus TaxID=946333 RepID=A0ABZ0CVC0_9BURK|nr:hypothetical protein [Piscinibacter gummiphilus]WOB06464.1 hypothetical protein RXV79_16200 [Piscinibacter gummiphilus]